MGEATPPVPRSTISRTQSRIPLLSMDEPRSTQPLLSDVSGPNADTGECDIDEIARRIDGDGTEGFLGLNSSEQKVALVNWELDQLGMGRYQWYIFFLCGFGYFLDLCWAQAFGLTAASIQQELGVSDAKIGSIFAAFSAGLTVGAFMWGLLVDIIGRKWCFNLTCLISSVFGLLFALPSNFGVLCFLTAMIGIGVGGNIPIDATITLEFLPKNRRFLLAALSTFQPLGVIAASLIAFALIPSHSCQVDFPACSTGAVECCTKASNMGWRYTMLTLGTLTMLIFLVRFLVFNFQESPTFLLSRGKEAEAVKIIQYIADFNGTSPPRLSMEDFRIVNRENEEANPGPAKGVRGGAKGREFERMFGHLRGLVDSPRHVWLFVTMTVAYVSLFFSFSIAGGFLPLILRAKGVDTTLSVEETYRSYIYIYAPGVTASLFGAYLMETPRIGMRIGMIISAGLMGVCLILFQLVNSRAANIGFNALEYWFQSLYGALLYAYTPEAFPGPVRGSASGLLSTFGRLAGIAAPVIAGTVYHGGDSPGVLYLAGGAAWVSMLAVGCLPIDGKGSKHADESAEDAIT